MESESEKRPENPTEFQVLIIDDDASFRKVLQLRLRSFLKTLQVVGCETLTDARATLARREEPLDLVVLDEHLPDGRGVELLQEGWFEDLAVLCVSSDTSPEIPGRSIKAGATYFLTKIQISEPLFEPLVTGIIDRNKVQQELKQAKLNQAVVETVKTLVATLRHEIRNPLGVVLGAAHLIQLSDTLSEDQKRAAQLVETSGKRINHVLDQLCEAVEMKQVKKADIKVFHIPGDDEWG